METKDKPRIRLIAVDLDGTLLTSGGILALEGARLLKAAAQHGVYVVLATARFPASVQDFCRVLEINAPIICMNGAQVFASPDGPVLASLSFPRKIGLEIARLADANGWEISTSIGFTTYHRQRPGQALGPISQGRVIVGTNTEAITGNPVRILTHDAEAITGIRMLCESGYSHSCSIDLYHRADGEVFSLGVFPKRANKGNALSLILRHLQVDRAEVLAIGDDNNDIPMFAVAKTSVAMSNAPHQVKQRATSVAPSNDEEGVAWALNEFGLSP